MQIRFPTLVFTGMRVHLTLRLQLRKDALLSASALRGMRPTDLAVRHILFVTMTLNSSSWS